MGSSELGLSRDEVAALSENDENKLKERKAAVRAAYYKAGADYIIDDMDELLGVVTDINRKLDQNAARKLTTMPTFRLGNIGDVYPSDMAGLVEAIGDYVYEK